MDKTATGNIQAKDEFSAESLVSRDVPAPLNISKCINPISLAEKRVDEETIGEEELVKIRKEVSLAANQKVNADKSGTSIVKPAHNTAMGINAPEDGSVTQRKPTDVEEVSSYFLASGYPGAEAVKFFHYYSSTGWKLGGKTPIENWQSAAHSWMLHAQNTHNHASKTGSAKREPDSNHLHARTDKNYAEPL